MLNEIKNSQKTNNRTCKNIFMKLDKCNNLYGMDQKKKEKINELCSEKIM